MAFFKVREPHELWLFKKKKFQNVPDNNGSIIITIGGKMIDQIFDRRPSLPSLSSSLYLCIPLMFSKIFSDFDIFTRISIKGRVWSTKYLG